LYLLAQILRSDSPLFRGPDVLVDLQVESRFQLVAKHPGDEVAWLDLAKAGRKQHLAALFEAAFQNDLLRPGIIFAGADDKFDGVTPREMFKVGPMILAHFARCRCFDIENDDDVARKHRNFAMATGLDHHLVAKGEEILGEDRKLWLQEGLASREEDEAGASRFDVGKDRLPIDLLPPREGIFGITIATAEIAGREAHQGTREPRILGLPLDARVDFI
jgi:hypothetical protein